jgi:hypothetical protein
MLCPHTQDPDLCLTCEAESDYDAFEEYAQKEARERADDERSILEYQAHEARGTMERHREAPDIYVALAVQLVENWQPATNLAIRWVSSFLEEHVPREQLGAFTYSTTMFRDWVKRGKGSIRVSLGWWIETGWWSWTHPRLEDHAQ